ncbi:SCO family protein [Bombella sp. TMW 2.2543]|uniref:SCO family protein n=1 Tax=Bombella pluederhausensis TaxID=2967336 RepID=A0ABT3WDY4_9PROT|nr:SCO family protein [Bombella pluederhausensis]MCX5617307.1 SCO family protein [Bombella pluederhausensis]
MTLQHDEEKTGLDPKKKVRRAWLMVLGLFLLAVLLGYGGYWLSTGTDEGARVHTQGNAVGGSFRVFSLGGGMVTEGDFQGSWTVVWFVDPRCPPERCQPPLRALDQTLVTMKQKGRKALPLVVSLDAKAEDPDTLKDYVMGVAPHIFPVFATPNMTQAMTRLFHAPYELEAGQTYYRPAPSFIVMTPAGHYAGTLPITDDATALTAGLEQLMATPDQNRD